MITLPLLNDVTMKLTVHRLLEPGVPQFAHLPQMKVSNFKENETRTKMLLDQFECFNFFENECFFAIRLVAVYRMSTSCLRRTNCVCFLEFSTKI